VGRVVVPALPLLALEHLLPPAAGDDPPFVWTATLLTAVRRLTEDVLRRVASMNEEMVGAETWTLISSLRGRGPGSWSWTGLFLGTSSSPEQHESVSLAIDRRLRWANRGATSRTTHVCCGGRLKDSS